MDDDRAAILRRRALFLGSTVAALGSCARTAPPATEPARPVVAVSKDVGDGGPTAEPDAGELPPREAHEPELGDLPPLDVPGGVSETARRNYENLASTMQSAHRVLGEALAALPDCSVTSAACESRWHAMAEKYYELQNVLRFFHICPGHSPEAQAFAERERRHLDYFQARRKTLDAALEGRLVDDAARQRFGELLADVRSARPMPCLSFACGDW